MGIKTITIIREIFDLKPGEHTVKLMCCVNGNELFIPHLNLEGIEYTIKPEISGKMVVLGFN